MEQPVEDQHYKDLIKISKLYFEEGYNQIQIAKLFKISKSTISRYLVEAHNLGIVKVAVEDLHSEINEYRRELIGKFGVKDVKLVDPPIYSEDKLLSSLAKSAAKYIDNILDDGNTVGISLGRTLSEIVNYLPKKRYFNSTVVELIGSSGKIFNLESSGAITTKLAIMFDSKKVSLRAPLIVSSKEVRNIIMGEEDVKFALDWAKGVDIAIVGIGEAYRRSSVIDGGILTEQNYEELRNFRAAGNICFRFYDIEGNIIRTSFDDRIIGIDLDDFRKIKLKVAIAGGQSKVEAIKGALIGKLIDVLITDINVAKELLK
ncbi:MAG: hypothetical protein M1371_00990 [Actinobacteria bacterium]|nr:hypothetical protein [Actinomycetota bacterium]